MGSASHPVNRRGLLTGAAAAAATAALVAAPRSLEAADNQALVIGKTNIGSNTTALLASVENDPSLSIINLSDAKKATVIAATLNTLRPPPNRPVAVSGIVGSGVGVWGEGAVGLVGFADGDFALGISAHAEGREARGGVLQGSEYGLQAAGNVAGLTATGVVAFTAPRGGGRTPRTGPAADPMTGPGIFAKGTTGVVATASPKFLSDPDAMPGVGVQTRGPSAGVVADGGTEAAPTIGVLGRSGLAVGPPPSGAAVAVAGLGIGTGVVGVAGAGAALTDVPASTTPVGIVAVGKGAGSTGLAATAGPAGTAVKADGGDGVGVLATATGAASIAVRADGGPGMGVVATSSGADGVALSAENLAGRALVVSGTAAFTQAGIGSFEVGERVARVRGRKATASSGVVATLNQPAGPGTVIERARIRPDGTVVVRLNQAARRPATFTFFVVDEIAPPET